MTTALLVVAHPDDELIFAGELLLRHPWNWTVVSLTGGETARANRLSMAMWHLRNEGMTGWSRCHNLLDTSEYVDDSWRKLARLALPRYPWDIVFTHNRDGDYGHVQHEAVSDVVRSFYTNVWEFGMGTWGLVEIPTSEKKRAILRASYPEELAAIERDTPHVAAYALGPVERFTGEGVWPV